MGHKEPTQVFQNRFRRRLHQPGTNSSSAPENSGSKIGTKSNTALIAFLPQISIFPTSPTAREPAHSPISGTSIHKDASDRRDFSSTSCVG